MSLDIKFNKLHIYIIYIFKMNDGTVKYFFSVDSKAGPLVILIDLWLGLILLAHKEGLRLADILRRRPDDAMGECWSVQVSPSDDKYCFVLLSAC